MEEQSVFRLAATGNRVGLVVVIVIVYNRPKIKCPLMSPIVIIF